MKTYAFIDASNLFYGGEKSLGWKIDYKKLLNYLNNRYNVSKAYYFGGVEIHGFPFNYLINKTVPLEEVEKHIINYIEARRTSIENEDVFILERHLKLVRFYIKLKEFGYHLKLKPIKTYMDDSGNMERKANCDVDMTFYMMRDRNLYKRVIFLSGDGDFLPVLKYLREMGKQIEILARAPRTAREIRRFAGSRFRDFEYIRKYIEFIK